MNLEIQLISKPEMTVREARNIIAKNIPAACEGEIAVTGDPNTGTVTVKLNQEKLTDAQRDWLHMSDFAARYIDAYHVEELERWTLQSAGDYAEKRHADEDATNVQDSLWFLAVVNARAGEQIERATNALERIATVLEAWHQQGKWS